MDLNKFWKETTNDIKKKKDSLIENTPDITNQIREWVVSLFSQANAYKYFKFIFSNILKPIVSTEYFLKVSKIPSE